MMIQHTEVTDTELRRLIQNKEICYGGNRKLKIYGLLSCSSGKRMKKKNRVFFTTEAAALQNGYRPCGHCMREAYHNWKNGSIQSNDR
ncbi:Ada metal-binding domain-containing protein [Flagellimonas lutimaris]|uniref:Ada metal-binding domain-containing protein n=1 Tax=Flagellimonas lutimaris TaxID=475082 RepID=UPI003F5CDF02